ncbi:DUF6085 family protein [Actinoplanes sp. NPDC049118]|uniref:DUF6085 family protein n=1 Tax=Actinoplanes sp. NPDC049118 TaxID=3155769 RepID=UPI0033E5EBAA
MSNWKRSSLCGNTTCVEVLKHSDGTVRLRDSKHPLREPLNFSAEEWADFIAGAVAGEFGGGDEDPHHVIEFRTNGWTIKHPLSCRPRLFDCEVNRVADECLTEPPASLGRFVCSVVAGRFVLGERRPDGEP